MAKKVAAVLAGMMDLNVDPLLYSLGSQMKHQTALDALRGDWERVGGDLWKGVESEKAEHEARGSLSPQPKKNPPESLDTSHSNFDDSDSLPGSDLPQAPDLAQAPDLPQGAALVSAKYSGPLPLPSHFEHYDRILPGAADRILKMGELEQAARQDHQARSTKLEEFKTYWGFGAWALTLVAVVFLAYIGKTVVAAILASGIGLLGIGRILTAIRGGTSSE